MVQERSDVIGVIGPALVRLLSTKSAFQNYLATTGDTEERSFKPVQNGIFPPRPLCPPWWRAEFCNAF